MNEHKLRIAVADDEPDMRDFFRDMLTQLGHEVVAVAENGGQLVEYCRKYEPDLVITDIEMPEMGGLQAVRQITSERTIPVILVTAHEEGEYVEQALKEQQVLAYLIKPIKRADLQPAIALAMQRFREFEALHQQAANLQQALEDRKLIERAKGALMKRAELSEADAFRRLQLLSSQKNKKMAEIARMIVEADEAFLPRMPPSK